MVVTLALTACSRGASHIPPLHEIPGSAIGSVIENSRYDSRRGKVKALVQQNLDVLLAEADQGGGAVFSEVCGVADVSAAKCVELARQVAEDVEIYRDGTVAERVEKLTVAFMVYGG